MRFYGDYHIHSRHSDGKQNHREIVDAALKKGLREIAITDHGPMAAAIGVKNAGIYRDLNEELNKAGQISGDLRVYVGAEANIRGLDGKLDIEADDVENLDILIAGLHPYTLPASIEDGIELFARNSLRHLGSGQRIRAISNNTKACIEAIYRNPQIDILSHPGLFFQVNIEEVARSCVQKQVLFEINCGHEHPDFSDIMEANRFGVRFIVNSDAHSPEKVGDLEYGSKAVEKLGIDPEKVVNLGGQRGSKTWRKKARTCTY